MTFNTYKLNSQEVRKMKTVLFVQQINTWSYESIPVHSQSSWLLLKVLLSFLISISLMSNYCFASHKLSLHVQPVCQPDNQNKFFHFTYFFWLLFHLNSCTNLRPGWWFRGLEASAQLLCLDWLLTNSCIYGMLTKQLWLQQKRTTKSVHAGRRINVYSG